MDGCQEELLAPYADKLLERLMSILKESPQAIVLDSVMTTIAAIAGTSQRPDGSTNERTRGQREHARTDERKCTDVWDCYHLR